MENSVKNKKIMSAAIIIIGLILTIAACISDYGEDAGNLTINLSGGSTRSAMPWPPEEAGILGDLNYEITLIGNGQTINRTGKGGETIRVTVSVGLWNVAIKAFYKGDLYATGSNSVDVKAGQNNVCNITMNRAFGDPVPPCGHDWDWIETRDGVETKTCSICGATDRLLLTLDIGDPGPGGGIIFYRNEKGFTVEMVDPLQNYTAYYLEAAPVDRSIGLQWSTTNYDVATGTNIGTGRKNTALIIAGATAATSTAPAAEACNDYDNNGKSDWFLPSLNESIALSDWWNESGDRAGVNTLGLTVPYDYWTSSQVNINSAYYYFFGGPSTATVSKDATNKQIRPIRAF